MTMNASHRRLLSGIAVGVGGALVLAGCSGSDDGGGGKGSAQVRFSSYGDATKLDLRGGVLKDFSESNEDGITVLFEGTPSADYWDKLATQVAGNNTPDVVNIDAARVAAYGGRGVLEPLDDYADIIDMSTLDENLLKQGQLDGKQYGVPIAMSMMGWGYNQTVLDELGLEIPGEDWTWDSYAAFADEIAKASDGAIAGSEDASGDLQVLEVWLRTRGGQMWVDGEWQASAEDLEEWFSYWSDLRESGGIVDAEEAAMYSYTDWPNSPIARGTAVMAHIMTPNLAGGFRGQTEDTIGLTMTPADPESGAYGAFADPSSLLSISSKAEDKDAAAKVIQHFLNSDEAATALRLISGPPASSSALETLKGLPDLTEDEQEVIDFAEEALPKFAEGPEPAPAAEAEVGDAFLRAAQDIAFGRADIPDAVEAFLTAVDQAVANS